MSKPYTYLFDHSKPYYNRAERRLVEQDGTPAPAMLITRYTTGYHWQTNNVKGPRGGRARKQRKANVYYLGGTFYRNKSLRTEDGHRLNTYEVFDGIIFDTFETSSRAHGVPVVRIEVVEGVPVEVVGIETGETIWGYFENTVGELEELLQIPEAYRAGDEPAAATYDATEEAEQLDRLIESDQFGTDEYDAACDAYDERTEQISAEIVQTATEAGAVRIDQDGTTSYLHRSTRHDGLQLTLWDDLGPVGHYDVTDGGDLAQYIDYQRGPVTVTAA